MNLEVEERCIDCNEYVAIVSRQLPTRVSLEESLVYAITDCPLDSTNITVGSYLVIESDNRKYLARVVEITNQDVYSLVKSPIISLEQELSVDLTPLPRLITLELVVECVDNRCSAPVTPVKIHSRIRKPRSGEISEMLGLPKEGIEIGNISLPTGEELKGERVRLTQQALRHHILIVGTTGSGKTVLIKNIIYEVLKNNVGKVIVLDVVGHYHHVITREVDKIAVILPITSRYLQNIARDCEKLIKDKDIKDVEDIIRRVLSIICRRIVEKYLNEVFLSFGIKYHVDKIRIKYTKYVDRERNRVSITLRRIDVKANIEGIDTILELYPWALETQNVLMILPKLSAVFTAQARLFYRRILLELIREYVKHRLGEEKSKDVKSQNLKSIVRKYCINLEKLYNFMFKSISSGRGRSEVVYQYIANKIGVHKGTLENIMRGFLSLLETDLFDVHTVLDIEFEESKYRVKISIREPDYDKLFSRRYVIVDLRNTTTSQEKLIVYRVLARLYRYVENVWQNLEERSSVIIAIDEAHIFFPQTREESEKELIESYLTMLARLGRARGIGLIFATHSPDDLNDLVIQLTNTKILLRSDEKILEKLGVPAKERRIITLAPPGLAYIKTFIFRTPLLVKLDSAKTIHVG